MNTPTPNNEAATQAWLDKLVPLLKHLKAGGRVKRQESEPPSRTFNLAEVSTYNLLRFPEQYEIHREPRVVFINEYDYGLTSEHHLTAEEAFHGGKFSRLSTRRFVEDLNWKPS